MVGGGNEKEINDESETRGQYTYILPIKAAQDI
jgi:hypothetical protein